MDTSLKRVGALALAGLLAAAGCAGENGDPGAPGRDGTDGVPGLSSTGLDLHVVGVTLNPDRTVSVVFTMKDDRGHPVDKDGLDSENVPFTPTFSLAYVEKDADGKVLPYVVLTKTRKSTTSAFSPGALNPSTAGHGILAETGPGSYAYTFPAGTDLVQSTALDPAKLSSTHTIWIQASRQTDADDRRTITPVNLEYAFVPSGSGTAERREVASNAGCDGCHARFRKYTVEDGFHGGSRVDVGYCGICHNPDRATGRDDSGVPAADAGRFVHRVHHGEHLRRRITSGSATSGSQLRDGEWRSCSTSAACACSVDLPCSPTVFHGIGEVTYPQDIRNCKACHEGAAQGDQWFSRPNRSACGSCHDAVSFVDTAMEKCNDAAADPSDGCRHSGGPQSTDATCASCHDAAAVQADHLPVLPKDPANTLDGGGDKRTNAAAIAAAGVLPPGASRLTAEVHTVSAFDDGGGLRPRIKFRLLRDGAPVTFNAYAPGVEPITDFVGTIGLYFAWAEPQDGVVAPADFTRTANGNLRALWKGSATGTLTADGDGYYTATLTGTTIPAAAVMLTGGVGYQYDLPTQAEAAADDLKNMPLTQTNVPGYPFDPATKSGGLLVPVPNAWKTAEGYTPRRAIVSNEKCNACHAFLGVGPDFHVGQRNDGPTCSFCHNPNRTNNGWAVNAKDVVHAIHGSGMRAVTFNWHAECPTGTAWDAVDRACEDAGGAAHAAHGFWGATYPGDLRSCEACHLPGTYDFTASAYTASNGALMGNLLFSAAATEVEDGESRSVHAAVGDYTADPLVVSPITAACVACHDHDPARYHMIGNGGAFYVPRSTLTNGAGRVVNTEQCLVCHGPGKIAAIGEAHR